MLSRNDKARINDMIDFLCKRELEAKGTNAFFKKNVIQRVLVMIDLPNKHDEFTADSYRKSINARLTTMLSKKHDGIRLWICDKSAGNRWQSIRGVSPRRLRAMIDGLDYLDKSVQVSYSRHVDFYNQMKALGVGDDEAIGAAFDGFAPRPIANRSMAA